MKFRKNITAFLAAVTAASLVIGCGNSGSASTADNGNTAPGSKGSIEFWTVFTGEDGSSMQAIVDAYNATNPQYTVNHRALEAKDLYLNVPLAIQSGQGVPDVVINHIERIPVFQENGFLTDLKPLLEENGISPDNYNTRAWEMSDLNGGHFGIPLDVHSFIMYVNMDLYEQYGNGELDDGVVTWDEIYAAANDLTAANLIPFPITWQRANFLSSYGQLNGSLSADGQTPDFNNRDAIKVMELWRDLYDKGYTIKEGDAPWEMFLGGQAMFCPEGCWMYNSVKEAGLNVKMIDYPVFDVNAKGNWTSSHQFVIPKDDKRDPEKVKAIFDFIDFVGNNSLEWAKAGQVPAHVSIKENAEFREMPQAFLAEYNEELKLYDFKYYGYAVDALDKITGEVLFGRMTPEEGLNQAVRETKDSIELGN